MTQRIEKINKTHNAREVFSSQSSLSRLNSRSTGSAASIKKFKTSKKIVNKSTPVAKEKQVSHWASKENYASLMDEPELDFNSILILDEEEAATRKEQHVRGWTVKDQYSSLFDEEPLLCNLPEDDGIEELVDYTREIRKKIKDVAQAYDDNLFNERLDIYAQVPWPGEYEVEEECGGKFGWTWRNFYPDIRKEDGAVYMSVDASWE
jgi:hypothetical protein